MLRVLVPSRVLEASHNGPVDGKVGGGLWEA